MTEKVKAIFDESMLATLATVSEDGSPWATPVHVVTDGAAVYWFSSEEADHSRNIARTGKVSAALFSRDFSNGLKGVYMRGTARIVPEDERNTIVSLYGERAGFFQRAFSEMAVYRLELGQLDEKKSTGNCWYFYS